MTWDEKRGRRQVITLLKNQVLSDPEENKKETLSKGPYLKLQLSQSNGKKKRKRRAKDKFKVKNISQTIQSNKTN